MVFLRRRNIITRTLCVTFSISVLLNGYALLRMLHKSNNCQMFNDNLPHGLVLRHVKDEERGFHYTNHEEGLYGSSDGSNNPNVTRKRNGDGETSLKYTDKDLDGFLLVLNRLDNVSFPFSLLSTLIPYDDILRRAPLKRGSGLNITNTGKNWERFHLGINKNSVYSPDDDVIDALMNDLETLSIVNVEEMNSGTQLKLILTFSDGGKALMKPQRFPRDYETPPNRFYIDFYEHHWAEVAGYHLDRVLGFHRVPPTVGRIINITRDIWRHADHRLRKTFYVSPAGNQCFHGSCRDYCDVINAFCGNGDLIEASVAVLLPDSMISPIQKHRNPWMRTYRLQKKAYWEVHDDLCMKIRIRPPFNNNRRLLDIMDMTVFDYLMGNMDRHHYDTFREFGNDTFLLHLDNGEGFGASYRDEMSILAPVEQCCMIRHSTFIKLVKLYKGPDNLSEVMRRVMSASVITPVLTDPMLDALDRRVMKVLQLVMDCVKRRGQPYKSVIVDDHMY